MDFVLWMVINWYKWLFKCEGLYGVYLSVFCSLVCVGVLS